ncbi:hypothetical protein VIGAN_04109100 [Vigna angularis var. angularis]|uniref:Uncharacterized protein n=1 Tax=Vigna angularis var. angularis TaxID=157739 RepID=A0A0S3RTW2_PHAAN|nr:hypothetical protein VIGAN_04109100 [Vigna angularis var. angularis]
MNEIFGSEEWRIWWHVSGGSGGPMIVYETAAARQQSGVTISSSRRDLEVHCFCDCWVFWICRYGGEIRGVDDGFGFCGGAVVKMMDGSRLANPRGR